MVFHGPHAITRVPSAEDVAYLGWPPLIVLAAAILATG
jgi:hypothetical protein